MDYADRDHNRIWTGSSIICSMCIRYVIRGSYVYKAGIAGCDRGRSLSCVTDFVWNRGWIFYKRKHQKAKENVRSYYRGLVKLEKVSKRRKAEHE